MSFQIVKPTTPAMQQKKGDGDYNTHDMAMQSQHEKQVSPLPIHLNECADFTQNMNKYGLRLDILASRRHEKML